MKIGITNFGPQGESQEAPVTMQEMAFAEALVLSAMESGIPIRNFPAVVGCAIRMYMSVQGAIDPKEAVTLQDVLKELHRGMSIRFEARFASSGSNSEH